jgi:hypothetical protein
MKSQVSINRLIGIARYAVALAILASVAWQVTDRLANNLFRPTEYFAFFSIQTSLIAAVVLIWTGKTLFDGKTESRWQVISRMTVTACYLVVSIAYNALLRGSANDVRDGDYAWPVLPNEVIHVWAPLAIFLGWVFIQGPVKLKLRAALWVAVYPLAWLTFSVVRGLVTGWWPYWFIDPTGDGGVAGMFTYILAITVFLISLGFILILISRLNKKRLSQTS